MAVLSITVRIRSSAERLWKLAPIQMGETEAGEVIMVDRDVADAFFAAEDEAVTMAECAMM